MKLAIVKSQYNLDIVEGLYHGALSFLEEKGIFPHQVSVYPAPGAFELPLIAKEIAKSRRYDGVICLGCILKGETAHFEFISVGTTIGIMQAALETGVPISFGVLTAYSEEQAFSRSKNSLENKGREAARSCYETITTLRSISP